GGRAGAVRLCVELLPGDRRGGVPQALRRRGAGAHLRRSDDADVVDPLRLDEARARVPRGGAAGLRDLRRAAGRGGLAGGGRGDPPRVTLGPASYEAQRPERELGRKAYGEACRAARAAGVTFTGAVPSRFWPQWHRDRDPEHWRQMVASQRASAIYRIKAMAS